MQALRQQHATQLSSMGQRVTAAEGRAAQLEAAQVHAVQQQFADDCLKEQLVMY